jgi:hypothetical protein
VLALIATPLGSGGGGEILRQDPLEDPLRAQEGCCNIIWLDPETVCYLDRPDPALCLRPGVRYQSGLPQHVRGPRTMSRYVHGSRAPFSMIRIQRIELVH